MPEATVNATTLWYTEVGTGLPCLVLHGGLGFDHTIYHPALDPLGEDVRLVYLDQRCNGRSGRPPIETLTIEQLADDGAELVRGLGHDRIVVLGHSYGGFVAQELAIRYPSLVAGLVLVATTPGQPGQDEDADRYAGPPPPPEFEAVLGSPPATDAAFQTAMRALFPLYFHHPPADVGDAVARTVWSVQAWRRGMEILGEWSAVDRLAQIPAPALLVVGRYDTFTSPPQSERIAAQMREAEVVVFEESAHMPWLEEPERFIEVVRAWLIRTSSATRA